MLALVELRVSRIPASTGGPKEVIKQLGPLLTSFLSVSWSGDTTIFHNARTRTIRGVITQAGNLRLIQGGQACDMQVLMTKCPTRCT
jgi:hypothetical protein